MLVILGNDVFEDVGGDGLEFFVVIVKEDEDVVGLGVEGGRSVEGEFGDDVLDVSWSDGIEVFGKGVDGMMGFDGGEESIGGDFRYDGGVCGVVSGSGGLCSSSRL